MTLRQYIDANYLRPADVIVVKQVAGLVDSLIVYLGIVAGEHSFMLNLTDGIRIVTARMIEEARATFDPVRIRRFHGTDQERMWAVNRARNRRDIESYRLLLAHSEEKDYSGVAVGVGLGLLLLGLGIALFGGDDSEKKSSNR